MKVAARWRIDWVGHITDQSDARALEARLRDRHGA